MGVEVIGATALLVALIGGYTDVRHGKVYNRLTYPAAALGLAMQGILVGPAGLLDGATGLAAGLAILLIPYLLGVVGAGDAKLLAAVGAFIGPRDVAMVMLFGGLLGGVLAIGLLVRRRELVAVALQLTLAPRQTLAQATIAKGDFPFAMTVPLGLIATLLANRVGV